MFGIPPPPAVLKSAHFALRLLQMLSSTPCGSQVAAVGSTASSCAAQTACVAMAIDGDVKACSVISEGAVNLASAPPLANGVHPPKKNRGLRELVGLSDGSGIQLNEGRTRHAGPKPAASSERGEVSGTKAASGKARGTGVASLSQLAVSSSRAGKKTAAGDKQDAVDSPPSQAQDGRPGILPEPVLNGLVDAAAANAAPAAEPLADEHAELPSEAPASTAADIPAAQATIAGAAADLALSQDQVSDMALRAVANAAENGSVAPAAAASPSRRGRSTGSQLGALPPPSPAASNPRRSQRSGAADAAEASPQRPLSDTAALPSPQGSDGAAAAALPPPSPQRSVRSAALPASAATNGPLPPPEEHVKFVHADVDTSDVTEASAVPRAARSNIDRRPASSFLGVQSIDTVCTK